MECVCLSPSKDYFVAGLQHGVVAVQALPCLTASTQDLEASASLASSVRAAMKTRTVKVTTAVMNLVDNAGGIATATSGLAREALGGISSFFKWGSKKT